MLAKGIVCVFSLAESEKEWCYMAATDLPYGRTREGQWRCGMWDVVMSGSRSWRSERGRGVIETCAGYAGTGPWCG